MLNRVVPSVSREDGTGSCSQYIQTARRPLYSMLRLGDGGVRSGAGSFDLALNSVDGTKSAAARKNTYLSPLSGSSSVRPSIKQATKTVAALLFALRRVPGGRRRSSARQGAALRLLQGACRHPALWPTGGRR